MLRNWAGILQCCVSPVTPVLLATTENEFEVLPEGGRELAPIGNPPNWAVREQEAELSHPHASKLERHSPLQPEAKAQRFLAVHAATRDSFRVARHRFKAIYHRLWWKQHFSAWKLAPCVSQEKADE